MTKRTPQEWNKIIDNWTGSNLSMAEYCREHEINYWTFRDQIKRKRSTESTATDTTRLIKINPAPTPSIPAGSERIVIAISEKYKLEIPDGFNKETLQKIIDILGDRR